jgi:uncharacterized damage-inducible protein DinB
MSSEYFRRLALYNRWANARLYAAALDLSDQTYRLHVGVFFGSLHGTLNHLLLTDRLWLKRLTGEGDHPNQLNAILYDDRAELTRARMAEDRRLISVVEKYDEAALAALHSYRTTSGMPQSQVLSEILMHLFNHQTHHRGQAHGCLPSSPAPRRHRSTYWQCSAVVRLQILRRCSQDVRASWEPAPPSVPPRVPQFAAQTRFTKRLITCSKNRRVRARADECRCFGDVRFLFGTEGLLFG